MTWLEKLGLGLVIGLTLYALAAWNVAAYRRRCLRERQAARLSREAWPPGPDTASPGEGDGR